jgi:hypothetical protein
MNLPQLLRLAEELEVDERLRHSVLAGDAAALAAAGFEADPLTFQALRRFDWAQVNRARRPRAARPWEWVVSSGVTAEFVVKFHVMLKPARTMPQLRDWAVDKFDALNGTAAFKALAVLESRDTAGLYRISTAWNAYQQARAFYNTVTKPAFYNQPPVANGAILSNITDPPSAASNEVWDAIYAEAQQFTPTAYPFLIEIVWSGLNFKFERNLIDLLSDLAEDARSRGVLGQRGRPPGAYRLMAGYDTEADQIAAFSTAQKIIDWFAAHPPATYPRAEFKWQVVGNNF